MLLDGQRTANARSRERRVHCGFNSTRDRLEREGCWTWLQAQRTSPLSNFAEQYVKFALAVNAASHQEGPGHSDDAFARD